jgi:two-component system alkaline phosphatase synthesis response regulator PhoP
MAKIMVVDDDEDFTNLYKKTLTSAGFDTTTVNKSSVAIEMAYLIKPDIFIIDLMMPDIDGLELSRMIRKDTITRQTPIIIITALDDAKSKDAALSVGANDYLTKPFTINELKSRINSLLDKTN